MKKIIFSFWSNSLKGGLFFLTFSVLLVLVFRWLPVSYTPLMFLRVIQNKDVENKRIQHEWVHSNQIPNNLQLAVVCTEDQRFLLHHGFDFDEIARAMREADAGERFRGASTISQQTAKNIFLWPSSSFIRKGVEVWFTVLLEIFWSKQRILEVYLNSIEFGKGIYGCQAAAQNFFNKNALELTTAEAARLAIVLPNPIKFNVGKPSAYMLKRQHWALRQMRNYGGVLRFSEIEIETLKLKHKKSSKVQE